MGLNEVGSDNAATATRWGRRLGGGAGGAGTPLISKLNAAIAPLLGDRAVVTRRTASSVVRERVSWLPVLTLGAAVIVLLQLAHPIVYRLPSLRAATESVSTLLALAAAWLAQVRFAQTRRLRDLLLFGAFLTLALLDFVASALPATLGIHSAGAFMAATPCGQLLVAAMLALAVLVPDRLVTSGRRSIAIAAVLSVGAVGAAEIVGLPLRAQLLPGATHSGLLQHPLGFAVLLAAAVLFAYAASECAREGRSGRDSALALLAGATVLLAAARLCDLAGPLTSPASITPREGLTVLALALVFASALRRELQARAAMMRAAALAERRRVAQDLHDGLAQDLALIAAYGTRLAEGSDAEHPVAVAARRALAVSRDTISELSDMSATPAGDALEAIAHELSARFEVGIAVDAHPDADVAPDARDHVARIAREAIANAVRHGGARNIIVSLRQTSLGVALRVCDDGCGIAGASAVASRAGFGLRNMSERAAAVGGSLTVRQGRAGGTELEVLLP